MWRRYVYGDRGVDICIHICRAGVCMASACAPVIRAGDRGVDICIHICRAGVCMASESLVYSTSWYGVALFSTID